MTTISFEGRVAVITGAGGGLGRAHALLLASRGARVVVNDLGGSLSGAGGSLTAAQRVVQEIEALGGQAIASGDDVATRQGAQQLADAAVQAFGRIDVLINNAGYLHCAPALEYPLEQWESDMSVLLDAVFELSQQAGRIMVEQGAGGKIIQIGSTAAFKEGASLIAYATAKSALVGLTRCLAGALARHGINVNAIAPGIFNTDINAALFNNPEALAERCRPIPSGRLGEVEDIIGPMLFLASEMSAHVHGQTLVVDGGFTGA